MSWIWQLLVIRVEIGIFKNRFLEENGFFMRSRLLAIFLRTSIARSLPTWVKTLSRYLLRGGYPLTQGLHPTFTPPLLMTQPNLLELAKKKLQSFHWYAWFPYPSSWLRALILVPIAFPGARLIFLGFGGILLSIITNSSGILIFSVVFGLLIPTIILSTGYYLFQSICKKQALSSRWFKWVPQYNSFWEGFYATVVIGLSFLAILTMLAALAFLSCKLSSETAEEVSGCAGREIGRAAGAIFGSTDNVWDFSGKGVITRQQDYFIVRIWFGIWLIIAGYLYQIEYLVRHRFIPRLKVALQNYQSMRKTFKIKSKISLNKLLIVTIIPFVAIGIYLCRNLPEYRKNIFFPVASKPPALIVPEPTTVTPTVFSSKNYTSSPVLSEPIKVTPSVNTSETLEPQIEPFQQAVSTAMNAAKLTQTAQVKADWNAIVSQWQEAIALMKAVPLESANYQVAQKKAVEYQSNLAYAKQRAANSYK